MKPSDGLEPETPPYHGGAPKAETANGACQGTRTGAGEPICLKDCHDPCAIPLPIMTTYLVPVLSPNRRI